MTGFIWREIAAFRVLLMIAIPQVAKRQNDGTSTTYYIRRRVTRPSWEPEAVDTLELRGLIKRIPDAHSLAWGSESEAPEPPAIFDQFKNPVYQLTAWGWAVILAPFSLAAWLLW